LQGTHYAPKSAPNGISSYSVPVEDWDLDSEAYKKDLIDLKQWYREALQDRKRMKEEAAKLPSNDDFQGDVVQ